jgi:hypothetical protein
VYNPSNKNKNPNMDSKKPAFIVRNVLLKFLIITSLLSGIGVFGFSIIVCPVDNFIENQFGVTIWQQCNPDLGSISQQLEEVAGQAVNYKNGELQLRDGTKIKLLGIGDNQVVPNLAVENGILVAKTGEQGLTPKQLSEFLGVTSGQNGADGQDGVNGINGANGLQGNPGLQGVAGKVGQNGVAGPQGTAGTNGTNGGVGPAGVQGPIGLTGPAGAQGSIGLTGPSGIVTANSPLSYNGGTQTLSLTQATTSNAGYLSSSDFTIFNGKQNAITPQNVTANSNKISLGGTPTGATLQPFSIDINEANLSLNNIGGTLGTSKGGTGITNFNTGDTLYASAPNTLSALPIGANGQFYTSNGTTPTWQTIDIPTIADSRITLQKAQPNGLATLDATGKVPLSQLSATILNDVFVVTTFADCLTTGSVTKGDVCIVTGTNLNYVLQSLPSTLAGSWQQLLVSPFPVTSVNGQTGNVNLLTTDVAEGANLYYTNTRARNSISVAGLPLTYNSSTGVVGINQASGSQAGYLSAADFTTFNTKQNAITPQNVTAGSSKITLGGTPTGAALQPFSVDINEANLSLQNIGGSLSVAQQNGVDFANLAGTLNLTSQVSGVLPIGNGGTGLSTTPTNGQLLIGDGTEYILGYLSSSTSIIGDGTTTAFQLLNDAATPGGTFYYGTDASGTKGFYNLATTIAANNGLTNNNGTIQLGGSLVQDTNVDGASSYRLDLVNLSNFGVSAAGLSNISSPNISFGSGTNSFASLDPNQIALGDSNTLNGPNQFATGTGNILNGSNQVINGFNNNVVGQNIFTNGVNNNFSNLQPGTNQLFVTGFDNTSASNINVTNSFVVGGANQFASSGDTTDNYVIGLKNNLQTQNNAWIFGRDNTIKDNPSSYNYIFGNSILSAGNNNFSIGQNLTTNGDGLIDIGLTDGTKVTIDSTGRFTLRGSFSPGGNDGTPGQLLTSQGVGSVPVWSGVGSLLTAGSGISISGNTINNTGVLLTGNQTIGGVKTFNNGLTLANATGITFNNATNSFGTTFVAGNNTSNLSYTLPIIAPTTGQVLVSNSSGVLSWTNQTSGAPLSSLTAATTTNTIANGNNAQTWNWLLTGATNGLNISEATGSTTGTGYLLNVGTIASSTAKPFRVLSLGNAIIDTTSTSGLILGNITGSTSITQRVGTGNFSLDGVGASTYAIGASTTTGTIDIGGTAQTGGINIGSSTGLQTITIGKANGTGSNNSIVSIGQVIGNTVGTPNSASSTVNIGTAVGTVNAAFTGSNTINVGNSQNNTTLNLGNGAGAHTVNIAGVNSNVNISSQGSGFTATSYAGSGYGWKFVNAGGYGGPGNFNIDVGLNNGGVGFLATSATSAVGATGALGRFELTNAGTNAELLALNNAGNGYSFRVNDNGTYTDSSPFQIDANGNVGVGVLTANNKLELNQGTAGNSGLRFTQLTSASTAGSAGSKVLSVDANGDVVLVTDSGTGSISTLAPATATNTIDNTNFAQTWNWSTATTQNPLTLSGTALTTGSLLNLTGGTYSSGASLNISQTGGAAIISNTPGADLTTPAGNTLNVVSGTTGNATFDSGTTGLVNIGTSANPKTVTVGNTNTTSALNLRSGSGKISAISSTLGVELLNNAVSWTAISDRSTKENLVVVDNALAKINTLTGYNYNYKAEFGDSTSKHNGLIAQDVQAVLPDAVGELSNGKLGIQYDQLTALTVNAIKELNLKVDALDPAKLADGKEGLAFVNKQMEQAFDRITKLENRLELVETKNLDQDTIIRKQQATIDLLLKRVEDLEKMK